MSYEWQEGWVELVNPDQKPEYIAAVHRAVMAAVNWMAEHPKAKIRYRIRDLREIANRGGIDPAVPLERVEFIGGWKELIRPDTSDCRQLCRAIDQAVANGEGPEVTATFTMMDKALHCAHLFHMEGWDEFSKFMFTMDTEGTA